MITESDKGWMAGILDYKGRIQRKNNKDRAAGSMQVTLSVNTQAGVIIERLCALTGTAVEVKPDGLRFAEEITRRGCGQHCPEAHIHVASVLSLATSQWTVTGASAAIVLWNLREYMVSDHEPWDWALGMCLASTRLSGRGSGMALAAIRRLAGLGWDVPPLMRDVLVKEIKEITV